MPSHDPSTFLRAIHVDAAVRDEPYTREILKRATSMGVQVVSAANDRVVAARDLPHGAVDPAAITAGKRHLYLTVNRGRFLKPCPATREYNCCGYHVLNIGANCPMDCSYCILQAYLNNPWLAFYVNIDDLFAELHHVDTAGVLRIGTGEFTDSLALERLTRLNERLVAFFADQSRMVLELKSKATVIDDLAGLEHRGRTIVAWSLNSPAVMARQELRTASLDQRLAAAARCADLGYPLAFHFDPIVFHPDWREGYGHTIDRLFATVPADQIVWISLGALRFLPALGPIARRRFPNSAIFDEEFIDGLDGKKRYFRSLRRDLYRYVVDRLQQYADPRTCLYFCMESDELWREVFGFTPAQRGGLAQMLDEAAARFCGVGPLK